MPADLNISTLRDSRGGGTVLHALADEFLEPADNRIENIRMLLRKVREHVERNGGAWEEFVHAKNGQGETALDVARSWDNTIMEGLLNELGGRQAEPSAVALIGSRPSGLGKTA